MAFGWDPFVIGRLTWSRMADWRSRAEALGLLDP